MSSGESSAGLNVSMLAKVSVTAEVAVPVWGGCRCNHHVSVGGDSCGNRPRPQLLPLRRRWWRPRPQAGTPPGLTRLCWRPRRRRPLTSTQPGGRRPAKDPPKDRAPPPMLQREPPQTGTRQDRRTPTGTHQRTRTPSGPDVLVFGRILYRS